MSMQNVLYQGSTGEPVRILQQKLKDLGYDVGEVDADFGPKTAAAVQKFQQDQGLQVDAQAGPQTMNALYGAQAAQPGPGAPPSLTPAQEDVYRQAEGLGIPRGGVDPGYVAAVGADSVQEYIDPFIAKGIAARGAAPPAQRPVYGAEGGRKGWQENIQDMTRMIGGYQQANPVYMPFPAGTPTGAGSRLLEEARNNAAQLALAQQEAANAVPKAPAVPTTNALRYGVSTGILSGLQSTLDEAAQAAGKTRLSPEEVGAWKDANLKGLLGVAWQEGLNAGLQTSDLESLSIDIENYLNAQAGLDLVKSLDFDTAQALQNALLQGILKKY